MSADGAIRFAILGAGMIAHHHRQAIVANEERGARLVAMGHHNPDRFVAIGEEFGVPCLSQDEMLRHPDIDVVCICTPSGEHSSQTIAAARAGKHVLVEKPMALNLADADAMVETCVQNGVRLGVVLPRRTEPLLQQAHRAILSGDLGDLTLGLVTIPYHRPQSYYEQADWRGTWRLDGGGVLMNQGIHLVDLLIWLMGDPVAVQAYGGTLHRAIEVEDTLTSVLRFAGGALATISATTTTNPGFPHRIEIYGTGGGIQLEGDSVVRWGLADPTGAVVAPEVTERNTDAGAGGDPRGISTAGHIAIVRDFVEALQLGRAPMVDGAEGRRSVATVAAIYQAAGLLSPAANP